MDSKINVVNLNKKKIENKTKTQKNFSIKNIFKSFLSNKNENLNEVKQKNTMQELSENDEKCKKTNSNLFILCIRLIYFRNNLDNKTFVVVFHFLIPVNTIKSTACDNYFSVAFSEI